MGETCQYMQTRTRRIRRSLDDDSVATLVHAFVASRVDYCGSLLIGAPKKTTDKLQVAMCPQLGSTNHLEHAQVRPGTHSFQAKSATLAGCCRPGSDHSLRPGVQMSAQNGSWIPVYLLQTRLRHLWPSPPAIGWPWSSRFPTCETCFVRTFICIRRPFELELTSCLPRDSSLSLSSFKHHLKTFLSSFY